jgi:hypothetical protein
MSTIIPFVSGVHFKCHICGRLGHIGSEFKILFSIGLMVNSDRRDLVCEDCAKANRSDILAIPDPVVMAQLDESHKKLERVQARSSLLVYKLFKRVIRRWRRERNTWEGWTKKCGHGPYKAMVPFVFTNKALRKVFVREWLSDPKVRGRLLKDLVREMLSSEPYLSGRLFGAVENLARADLEQQDRLLALLPKKILVPLDKITLLVKDPEKRKSLFLCCNHTAVSAKEDKTQWYTIKTPVSFEIPKGKEILSTALLIHGEALISIIHSHLMNPCFPQKVVGQ